jgi:hypothetical protein
MYTKNGTLLPGRELRPTYSHLAPLPPRFLIRDWFLKAEGTLSRLASLEIYIFLQRDWDLHQINLT